ncbi:hypothetical protein C8R44DRAFT_726279 [Mycena epipterygia]|nr:hypothetical protein C8R44DRAFT_726279 [Mycena epipterygia]
MSIKDPVGENSAAQVTSRGPNGSRRGFMVKRIQEWVFGGLALLAVRLVAAQTDSNKSRHTTLSPDTAGFIAAVVLFFLFGCCLHFRHRVQRAAARSYVPPPPPPPLSHHTGSDFPQVAPPPSGTYPYTPDSESLLSGTADFAPPPYVKESEGADGVKYPPRIIFHSYAKPLGPPPGIDATYSPPPGPPPPAHMRSGSMS